MIPGPCTHRASLTRTRYSTQSRTWRDIVESPKLHTIWEEVCYGRPAVTHTSQLRLFYKIWATPEHRFQEDTAANTIQGGFSWTVTTPPTQAHTSSSSFCSSVTELRFWLSVLWSDGNSSATEMWLLFGEKNVKHSPRKHSLTGQTLRWEYHGLRSLFHRWTQMNLLKAEGIIKIIHPAFLGSMDHLTRLQSKNIWLN